MSCAIAALRHQSRPEGQARNLCPVAWDKLSCLGVGQLSLSDDTIPNSLISKDNAASFGHSACTL